MFVRVKPAGPHRYLQVVENRREAGRVVQRVIGTLGRLDALERQGEVDGLMRSLGRFSKEVHLLEEHRAGRLEARALRTIGPSLVFGRLWEELGIGSILGRRLSSRRFEFPVERAVFLTVLHRLFESGSDRQADRWRGYQRIEGIDALKLHHLYRAMAWLGRNKAGIEEALFARTRDLFTDVSLAFFDTTTLYFEGRGGETLGRYGHSKDHRPDLRQMVVGAVLAGDGRPISCELWPGNHADAKALLPVVDRARERFGIHQVCWVADRGMISDATVAALESRGLHYILGARMRADGEVREKVLGRAGRFEAVEENLEVKEVRIAERRYVVCRNPEEAVKDAVDRAAIVASLEEELREGARHLIGNRGYRRFLKRLAKGTLAVDPRKVEEEARFDGKFVLRTNTDLPASEVALQYKRLLMVERFFRAAKSLLDSRPIFHQLDDTIRGHVFASFLALVLAHELRRRIKAKGEDLEWGDIVRDLGALAEVEVADAGRIYSLRTPLEGVAGRVFQAVGVAIPPPVRPADVVPRG